MFLGRDFWDVRCRRERRAERLRRAYEALGREQNGIFESLAEYTHELQAEVRALQITRDSLSVPGTLYVAQQKCRFEDPLVVEPVGRLL